MVGTSEKKETAASSQFGENEVGAHLSMSTAIPSCDCPDNSMSCRQPVREVRNHASHQSTGGLGTEWQLVDKRGRGGYLSRAQASSGGGGERRAVEARVA